jgi:hypothetical protein
VPHQARPASASRWTKPVLSLGVLSAVAATTLGLAAPAAAAESEYLHKLQPRYNYLSSSQLLSAGSKICSANHSGMPASDTTVMVSKDLGVSTSAAYEIVVNAINYLGC